MCGICGEITFDGSPASPHITERMTDCLIPRGPDSGGMLNRGRVSFGHRRLKIIDLSDKAEQPMVDSELGLSIAFNGWHLQRPAARAKSFRGWAIAIFSLADTRALPPPQAYQPRPASISCSASKHEFALRHPEAGYAVALILGRDFFGISRSYLAEQGKRAVLCLPRCGDTSPPVKSIPIFPVACNYIHELPSAVGAAPIYHPQRAFAEAPACHPARDEEDAPHQGYPGSGS